MPASRAAAPAPAAAAPAKVVVRTPNAPGYTNRVRKDKYDAMRPLVLKAVPRRAPGATQDELFAAIAKAAPKDVFPGTTSMWWAKCVQLDLEARGLLARVKGRPTRWRRT